MLRSSICCSRGGIASFLISATGLRRIMQYRMAHIDRRLATKRPGAGQHLVKQDTGGKDVGPLIDAIAARLLGRGISRRAVGNADFGQLRAVNSRQRPASSSSSNFARPKSRIFT